MANFWESAAEDGPRMLEDPGGPSMPYGLPLWSTPEQSDAAMRRYDTAEWREMAQHRSAASDPGSWNFSQARPPAMTMDCTSAYYACLRARGGMLKGAVICRQAKANCDAGFPTIFGPGIVGQ